MNVTYDGDNHLYKRQEQVAGTTIATGRNASFSAGNDLNSRAAYINADGALAVTAGGSVNIGAANQQTDFDQASRSKDSGLLSSTVTTTTDRRHSTQAIGSTFSGNSVTIQAAKDINVTGSNVVGTNDVMLAAANDVNISASKDSSLRNYDRTETKSGLMTSGNGIAIGTQTKGLEQTEALLTHNLSTIGSQTGNVNIQAGRDASFVGAQLQADKNVDISARNVEVKAVVDTLDARTLSYTETSGLRIGGKSNVTDAAMAVRAATNRGQEVNDPRLKALYAAKAAYAARDLAKIIETAQQSQSGAGGLSGRVSIGIGTTREESLSVSQGNSHRLNIACSSSYQGSVSSSFSARHFCWSLRSISADLDRCYGKTLKQPTTAVLNEGAVAPRDRLQQAPAQQIGNTGDMRRMRRPKCKKPLRA